jgi:hypothetical protein
MTTTAPRRAAQAARPKTFRRPKVPSPNAPNAAYAYDGAFYLGSIVEAYNFHFAFDPGGHLIGRFRTRIGACVALPGIRESHAAAMLVGCHPLITSEVLQ